MSFSHAPEKRGERGEIGDFVRPAAPRGLDLQSRLEGWLTPGGNTALPVVSYLETAEWIVTWRRSFDTDVQTSREGALVVTTLTRWKLSCALFAAIAAVATVRAHRGADHNAPATLAASSSRGRMPLALRRSIHVNPAAIGVSQQDLIDRIVSAKSVRDIGLLTDKLGMVGNDDAVDALEPMLADPRRGVPEAILEAFGNIATDRAVDVLVASTKDDRPNVRSMAITALGATHSERAEKLLIELSRVSGDLQHAQVLSALGSLGTDNAVARLIEMAHSGDSNIATSAIDALGSADTPAANAAMRTLLDSDDSRVVAAVIASFDTIDDELLLRLNTIVKQGDPQLVAAALEALGSAGEIALPVLREAALVGPAQLRWIAVNAIGDVGGAKAIAMLGDILQTGDRQSAGCRRAGTRPPRGYGSARAPHRGGALRPCQHDRRPVPARPAPGRGRRSGAAECHQARH